MTRLRNFFTYQRLLETSAAAVTLSGQALGSTTFYGGTCYAVATVLWWTLTIETRMWGLMPLNIISAFVTVWNLWNLAHTR